jgi:CheY-like chemotaxis protein
MGSQETKPRLLIVDDEVRILSALQRALRREGYIIETATSPAEGIQILEEKHVDLILSDNKMPEMSGLQFLAEARLRQPHVTCFLITGWTESVPPEELERSGVRELLTKPWDNETLKEKLRSALEG